MSTRTQPTPMERIKAGIWDIHEGISAGGEKQPAPEQDNIMKGTLPLFKYKHSLVQRYLLQKGFEEVLAAHRADDPRVARVVTDEQFHAEKSAEDLRYFGIDPATAKPVAPTTEFIAWARECAMRQPLLILAIHYVIEGSNNGAFYIAKAVQKAYGLEGTNGTYHLQPYGNEIRAKWAAFSAAFNANEYTETEMEAMIATGRKAFDFMNRITAAAYALPESAA